jgi:hypothetical protein
MEPRAADDDLYFEILKSERVRVRALSILMGSLFVLSLTLLVFRGERIPGFLLIEERVPLRKIAAFYGAAFLYECVAYTVVGIIIAKRRHFPRGRATATRSSRRRFRRS